jgi:hypothetical protein
MFKFLEKFILSLAYDIIIRKLGGKFYINDRVISIQSIDFYDWIYTKGYYLWIKEKVDEIKQIS